MSQHRISPRRGSCNPDRLLKGPNGRALCRECGVEVPKGRKSFCSSACVDSWKLRSDPTFVRIKLFERDRGVCALCGLNCVALVKELEALDPSCDYRWKRYWSAQQLYEQEIRENSKLVVRLKELCIPIHRYRGRRRYGIWDADHITPVVEGGGECTIDGYRTLCCQCHKGETAKLATRRAQARRVG